MTTSVCSTKRTARWNCPSSNSPRNCGALTCCASRCSWTRAASSARSSRSKTSAPRYSLLIARTLRDAHGQPLRQAFVKHFTVAAPDREPPDPARWTYTPPRVRTREPLAVDLAKSMDAALAARLIHVTDRTGRAVPGTAFLTERERVWIFLPVQSWSSGAYTLVVETTIEDLAGNNIGKPFEVELNAPTPRRTEPGVVKLPFELR